MKKFFISITVLVLVACNISPVSPTSMIDSQPEKKTSTPVPVITNTINPLSDSDVKKETPNFPQPIMASTVTSRPNPQIIYQPQSGDDKLQRDTAFVDDVQVKSAADNTNLPVLTINGSLPTPCHQLRAVVSPPDSQNRIDVKLYTLVDPAIMCAQMIKSYSISIPLENIKPATEYTILINKKEMARFLWP